MNRAIEQQGGERNTIAKRGAWDVLLCAQQLTAGCLALIPRDHAEGFATLEGAVMSQLPELMMRVQQMLDRTLRPDDVTVLLNTHAQDGVFVHVIPRFSSPRQYAGIAFNDPGWPQLPDMNHMHPMDAARREGMMQVLQQAWQDTDASSLGDAPSASQRS